MGCVFFLFLFLCALHKMDMNCPSVGWIDSFIYSSSRVAQGVVKERTWGSEGLGLVLWFPSYVSLKNQAVSQPQNARPGCPTLQVSMVTNQIHLSEAMRFKANQGWNIHHHYNYRKKLTHRNKGWKIIWKMLNNSFVRVGIVLGL